MRLDPNPLFRRVIRPWYDSNLACWLTLVAMFAVFLFSLLGIWVSRANPNYNPHTWYPAFMMVLSFGVLVSVAVRMIRRRNPPL